MNSKIRWGILGPGSIAHNFARGLKVLPDAELAAVGSRSKEKADSFADLYGIPRRYGSYDGLVDDPDVDVVYVATPHTFHREHSILCMKAGKAVLCEKPFAVNSSEVLQMTEYARKKGIFLMEAMWTRFLPVMNKVREWLSGGIIGEVHMLTVDLGFRAGWNPQSRLFDPELAGGALLDVGVYTVALAYMVFGMPPSRIAGMAHVGVTGVDEQTGIMLGYDQGQLGVLSCAIRTNTPQEAWITGTEGSIHIPDFWRAVTATLNVRDREAERVELPFEGTGYNYEAAEAMRCIREGRLESDIMPLDESLAIMRTMDRVREQIGVKYPADVFDMKEAELII